MVTTGGLVRSQTLRQLFFVGLIRVTGLAPARWQTVEDSSEPDDGRKRRNTAALKLTALHGTRTLPALIHHLRSLANRVLRSFSTRKHHNFFTMLPGGDQPALPSVQPPTSLTFHAVRVPQPHIHPDPISLAPGTSSESYMPPTPCFPRAMDQTLEPLATRLGCTKWTTQRRLGLDAARVVYVVVEIVLIFRRAEYITPRARAPTPAHAHNRQRVRRVSTNQNNDISVHLGVERRRFARWRCDLYNYPPNDFTDAALGSNKFKTSIGWGLALLEGASE
uniref:Uncharacterized protein n=1 Tax=Mycena chlorophos TaxID=658473 RepID=A0ABQ0MDM7_MYCCL|nr:predicted protein [Mycena chlorophos]